MTSVFGRCSDKSRDNVIRVHLNMSAIYVRTWKTLTSMSCQTNGIVYVKRMLDFRAWHPKNEATTAGDPSILIIFECGTWWLRRSTLTFGTLEGFCTLSLYTNHNLHDIWQSRVVLNAISRSVEHAHIDIIRFVKLATDWQTILPRWAAMPKPMAGLEASWKRLALLAWVFLSWYSGVVVAEVDTTPCLVVGLWHPLTLWHNPLYKSTSWGCDSFSSEARPVHCVERELTSQLVGSFFLA